tara:strand:- start:17813 stop:18145 length:333 start_codon:yes stop_codon:yes gene_type:complete
MLSPHLFQLLITAALLTLALTAASKPPLPLAHDPIALPNPILSNPDVISNSLSSLQRRWPGPPPPPAANAVWEAAKCKGRKFGAQMSYSDFDVGQMLPVPQNTAQSPWGI